MTPRAKSRPQAEAGRAPVVSLVSLGCPKNQVDSERILARLSGEGFHVGGDPASADLIVVNTCGFIEAAKRESIETILEMSSLKGGRCLGLVVIGCLGERYKDELKAEIPEADIVLGLGGPESVVDACRDLWLKSGRQDSKQSGRLLKNPSPPRGGEGGVRGRIRIGPPHLAYVKIAEGCDRACAFCAIPAIRGHFHSRPPEEIEAEVKALVREGVREVSLVSQDTVFYGRDRGRKGALADLVRRLAGIRNLTWLRVHYLYPTGIDDELLRVMAGEEKVCRYVDIPIQHADDAVLKRMGRAGKRADLEKVLNRIRKIVPEAAIRTTVLVGHPGEDGRAFQNLLEFIQAARFDHLGVFTYSSEEGTASFGAGPVVPPEEAEARRAEIMHVQEGISASRLREMVGRIVPILVDGPSEEHESLLSGRTEGQAYDVDGVVYLPDTDPDTHAPGSLVPVLITESYTHDLVGRPSRA